MVVTCSCGQAIQKEPATTTGVNHRALDYADIDQDEGVVTRVYADGSHRFETKAGMRTHYSFIEPEPAPLDEAAERERFERWANERLFVCSLDGYFDAWLAAKRDERER